MVGDVLVWDLSGSNRRATARPSHFRRHLRTAMRDTDARSSSGVAPESFTRAAPTRVSYGAITSYAFWLYAFGPALLLLREELHLSYVLIGVFSAVWSAGAAVSGAVYPAIVRRVGRREVARRKHRPGAVVISPSDGLVQKRRRARLRTGPASRGGSTLLGPNVTHTTRRLAVVDSPACGPLNAISKRR